MLSTAFHTPAATSHPTSSFVMHSNDVFQVHSLSISYSISAQSRYYVVIVVDEKTTRLMSVEKMPLGIHVWILKNLHIPCLTIKNQQNAGFKYSIHGWYGMGKNLFSRFLH